MYSPKIGPLKKGMPGGVKSGKNRGGKMSGLAIKKRGGNKKGLLYLLYIYIIYSFVYNIYFYIIFKRYMSLVASDMFNTIIEKRVKNVL